MKKKTISTALLGVILAFSSASLRAGDQESGPDAGHFDDYVLALSWDPGFCENKPQSSECASLTPDSFAARHLTLHGLWPDQNGDSHHDYGYCGVPPEIRSLDTGSQWCRMPPFGLSQDASSRLEEVMPGANSSTCLQMHEWYRHGSCSGLSPDAFFGQAGGLVLAVAKSGLGRFLADHTGQTVSLASLVASFESDYGAGSSKNVSFGCFGRGDGTAILSEVRIGLSKNLLPPEQLGQMLVPQPSGNCPPNFLIDAVSPR